MKVSTARTLPLHAVMLLFFCVFLSQADIFLMVSGVLPVSAANLLFAALLALALVLLVRAALGAQLQGRVINTYRRHMGVIAALVGVAATAALLSTLPDTNWDDGGKYVFLPTYDVVIILLSMLLPLLPGFQQGYRTYLGAALLVVVASVAADVVSPGTFSAFRNRPAGFPMNPNVSAFLLVALAAALLDYERVRPAHLLLLALSALAVLITLSRGGMLSVAVLLGYYLYTAGDLRRWNPRRQALALLVLAGGAAGLFALVSSVDEAAEAGIVDERRMAVVMGQERGVMTADEERFVALLTSAQLIRESPLLGHGTGYSMTMTPGPHNMFLAQMINNGIPGLVCYLLAVLGSLRVFWRRGYRPGIAFIGLLLLNSLFSHNLLEQRTFTVLLGVLLSLSYQLANRPPVQWREPPGNPAPQPSQSVQPTAARW
ncbi:MAG TPA: O-antigen ligase family protein [Longimicrobium sp.]|jgi:O-antigen ligase|uniref:O-antigen ligase family protein n=1 Tax=Longimicrobium sp. TaxID=2029185 RepID=UPI002ED830BB